MESILRRGEGHFVTSAEEEELRVAARVEQAGISTARGSSPASISKEENTHGSAEGLSANRLCTERAGRRIDPRVINGKRNEKRQILQAREQGRMQRRRTNKQLT